MRVCTSGSPVSVACSRFRSLIAVMLRRRAAASTPSGLETNSTGSLPERNSTPWCTVGRKPLPQQLLPPSGLFSPESRTTNAGRSVLSRAEAVAEPGSEARAPDHLVAGVHEDLRRRVVELRRVHRADDRDVVGELRRPRQQLRDLRPRLPVLTERERAGQQLRRALDEGEALPFTNSAGTSCPSCLASAGFGSNRSSCDGAPAMNRWMTRLARAGWCSVSIVPAIPAGAAPRRRPRWPAAATAGSSSDASARPPRPK